MTPSGATATYQWTICATSESEYADIGGATSNKYTPIAGDATKFIKVVATGSGNYTGTVTSDPTAEVEKADGPTAPAAPEYESKTLISITLVAVSGNEFKEVDSAWQDSNVFTGLNAGTGYTFTARVKETATHKASAASTGTAITTSVLTYTVTYDGNDSTGGAPPTDATNYQEEAEVTVLGNTGSLVRSGYAFNGWNTANDGSGTNQAVGSIFNMGAANVTLYAKWIWATSYSIGNAGPAGGWIFYNNGCYSGVWKGQYLEAAFSDQSTAAPWGCEGTPISGADGTAVGTGEQNTIDIEAGCTTVGTAADICTGDLHGYTDWFLPSKEELGWMYTNLHVEGVGDFIDIKFYWSSSEFDANDAWGQNFQNGSKYSGNKDANCGVRAVRAF